MLVRQADLTVLVLGEAQNMSGERASRATLNLPGRQQDLLEAAVAAVKPIVLLLMAGRPLDITWAAQHVGSILEIWYSGTAGGHAVANLLIRDAVPSGKLPVTWPCSVGQVPIFYNNHPRFPRLPIRGVGMNLPRRSIRSAMVSVTQPSPSADLTSRRERLRPAMFSTYPCM